MPAEEVCAKVWQNQNDFRHEASTTLARRHEVRQVGSGFSGYAVTLEIWMGLRYHNLRAAGGPLFTISALFTSSGATGNQPITPN